MIITWNLCFSMGFPTWKPGQLSPGMPCHRQWASRLLHNGFDPAQSLGLAKPYEHESSCIHLYKTAYYCYPHQCSFSQTSAFFTFVSVRVNFKWTILFAQKFQDTKPSHKISDMSTVNSKKKKHATSPRVLPSDEARLAAFLAVVFDHLIRAFQGFIDLRLQGDKRTWRKIKVVYHISGNIYIVYYIYMYVLHIYVYQCITYYLSW